MDFAAYTYDKGDSTTVAGIRAKIEKNLKAASLCLEALESDAVFGETLAMKMGEATIGEMPRAVVVRSMLTNHLYYHRGQ